jgi:hypothetical protein
MGGEEMGDILGVGVTHYPGLMLPDAYMSSFLTRTLKSYRIPAEMKEPSRWPEPLRRELAANQEGGGRPSIDAVSSAGFARRARRSMHLRPISC